MTGMQKGACKSSMGTRILLRWAEPVAIKRARLAVIDPWYPNRVNKSLRIAALAAVAFAVYHACYKAITGESAVNYWGAMAFVAVAAGALLGLLEPWVLSFLESQAFLSSDGIHRNLVAMGFLPTMQSEFWGWDVVGRLESETMLIRDQPFTVLVLFDRFDHRLTSIGLAPQSPLSELTTIAESHGVRLDRQD